MSMRLRYLASLKAKSLKGSQTKTEPVVLDPLIEEKVETNPAPVVHTQEEVKADESVTEVVNEIDKPLAEVVSEPEVSEINTEEVVEDETPKKKSGRRFGKDSA